MAATRGYSAGKLMIELDGKPAGFLIAVEGGEPVGSVVAEAPDGNGVVRKHVGSVAYEPIRMSFGTAMGETVYQWMTDWLKGKRPVKSGAIVFLDYQFNEQSRLEFVDALITEVAFPALDAAGKEAAHFTVALQPEITRASKASAGTRHAGFGRKNSLQWLASNFRLKIDKLPTTRVSKIDALVVKQQSIVREDDRVAVPQGPLQIPDLSFTVSQIDGNDFFDWFDDFAIKGNNAQDAERNGTIEFLAPNLNAVLFTLDLSRLGIFRVGRERSEAGAEVIARLRVEMYCEQIAFSPAPDTLGSAVVAAPSPSPAPPPATAPSPASPTGAKAGVLVESERIALRLQTTRGAADPGVSSLPRRDQGAALGSHWATDTATLDELEQIAAIEARDWTAIKLAAPHSLITVLVRAGVLPAGGDEGSIELARDGFIEGIVTGASQVLRSAAPHLVRG